MPHLIKHLSTKMEELTIFITATVAEQLISNEAFIDSAFRGLVAIQDLNLDHSRTQ
jgi:hypothetical protein